MYRKLKMKFKLPITELSRKKSNLPDNTGPILSMNTN